jgi:hypothetical protein
MNTARNKTATWGKPGNIAMFGAFSLAIVLGFAALVVDVGLMYWIRQQEQTVAEAAALAAAKELDFTPTGISNARAVASAIVSANDPADSFSFDQNAEVIFGVWDGTTFTEESEPLAINAVRVKIIRSAAKQNAYTPVIAGAVFGANNITISNRATALAEIDEGDATEIDCGIASKGQMTLSGNVEIDGDSCGGANVSVSGSVDIDGDLACGPNSTLSVNGSVDISGSTECLSESLNIPNVTLPSNIATNNNNANVVCSSSVLSRCFNTSTRNVAFTGSPKTLTLPAGTYFFNNITITGQHRIIATGDVTIYVTGTISAAGQGVVNNTSNTNFLDILVSGTGSVSFSGTSNFNGHIYAPQSSVSVSGTADYTGSITGNTVTISGTPNIIAGGTIPITGTTGTTGGSVTTALVQ